MNDASQTAPRARASIRTRVITGLLWGVLVAGGLLAADSRGLIPQAPDNWTYDWRTALLSPRADRPRDDIAVVLIDEDSLSQYPSVSPIDRGLLAAIVRALHAAGAKVIALDFIFDREVDEAKTNALIEAVQTPGPGKVVLGAAYPPARMSDRQRAYQEQFLARAGREFGHVIVGRDPRGLGVGDQVVRYIAAPIASKTGEPNTNVPAFGVRIAGVPAAPVARRISWLRRPETGGADLFPTIRIPPHPPGRPDDEILPPGWRGALKDRIVLVGADFADRDQHFTPLSVVDGKKTPGVTIHAQIVAQLRDGRSILVPPTWAEAVALALLAWLGFWLATRWQLERYGFWVWLVGVAALVVAGSLLFARFSLIIPSASLFFAWLAGVWGGRTFGPPLRRIGLY